MKLSWTVFGTARVATRFVPGCPSRAPIATRSTRPNSPTARPVAFSARSIRNVRKTTFVEERRSGGDRRSGRDRRSGGDRRKGGDTYRGAERRKGGNRRGAGDRRSGQDRRGG